MVLVTLGGRHLLDGLVACPRREAHNNIVRCSGEMIVRGIVLTRREPRTTTVVEHLGDLVSFCESAWEPSNSLVAKC